MLKTEKIVEVKKSHKKKFHKDVTIDDWSTIKALYYRVKLHQGYKNLKNAIYQEKNDQITEYIKSFYPDFNYKPTWKPGAGPHNFIQALEIIDKISENPEIIENIPMIEESLKITIQNLENKEKLTFPAYDNRLGLEIIYTEMLEEKFREGNRYRITVEYKGLKGYNFKMWIRRKLI